MNRQLVCTLLLIPTFSLWSQQPLIQKIALYGNKKTKDHIILRELKSREGAPLSESELRKDRAWLLRQGFLKRVEFQMKRGSDEMQRVLLLVVQEKRLWSISPIVSNNDLFGWYAGFRASINNGWGRRNQIEATFQIGGIQYYAFSWNDPWFGGSLRLFAGLEISHSIFDYRYSDYKSDFYEKDTEASFTLGKAIGRKLAVGIRTGIESIWVGDTTVTYSNTHIDRLTVGEFFIRFDSRDWPQYPRTGVYLTASSKWSGLFQPHGFRRTGLDFRFYSPVYNDNVLALQTVVEISDGTVPVYRRIHLGGAKTIRGYPTGSLAGENSLLMSLEYRFPILYERNPLAGIHVGYIGVLFIDAATTWFKHETILKDSIRKSAGFGIHLIWDHWIFRAEYGNHGKGWGFINIGSGIKF
jgi:outer membrane protein insertion porin family